MKSTEFVTEDLNSELHRIQSEYNLDDEIMEMAVKIKQDCQPYLRENPSPALWSPMFRGLRRSAQNAEVVTKNVRLGNRNPSDMPTVLHQYINEYFIDYHGAPFRNAMFCTGSSVEASGYGDEYIIFPIGDFEYIWSPKIEDLWMAYDRFTSKIGSTLDADDDIYLEFMDDVIFNADWKTTDLKSAIDSKHEIMVRCKAYHGVAYNEMEDGSRWRGISEILAL